MSKLTVGLFNDSFPPTIDGVANAVFNYATYIQKNHGTAVVATPRYPNVTDDYPFEVIRYASAGLGKKIGYRAGYPFDISAVNAIEKHKLDIIHSHCPFVSTMLARVVRYYTGVPIVFTYHTKFDIDISKRVAFRPAQEVSLHFLVSNINACDEVWVVSEGAGQNLRSIGYKGPYVVMPNGTDFTRGRSDPQAIEALRIKHSIQPDETVFLFVGRMMWYKGVRLILDGLRDAATEGCKFKMIFVGDGYERQEMMDYAKELGMEQQCIFTGAIRDREELRCYYSLADLFLFPSTYDTNGLVVREAAACECPCLLIRGSCAAEGIIDGDTGILIDETSHALGRAVVAACVDRALLRRIGRHAAEKIYLSWEDAIAKAYERYQVVLQNAKPRKRRLMPAGLPLREQTKRIRRNYRRVQSKVIRKVRNFLEELK